MIQSMVSTTLIVSCAGQTKFLLFPLPAGLLDDTFIFCTSRCMEYLILAFLVYLQISTLPQPRINS